MKNLNYLMLISLIATITLSLLKLKGVLNISTEITFAPFFVSFLLVYGEKMLLIFLPIGLISKFYNRTKN